MSTTPATPAPAKKSFFSKLESFFKKVFGSSTWERTAETAITITAPLLETLVALTAGEPAAAALTGVIKQAENDLAGTAVLLQQAQLGDGTAKTQATNMIAAVDTNLQTLLTDAQIKDPATLEKVTAVVNTVSGELQAILAAV
jgi:hypothetical protein